MCFVQENLCHEVAKKDGGTGQSKSLNLLFFAAPTRALGLLFKGSKNLDQEQGHPVNITKKGGEKGLLFGTMRKRPKK